MFELLLTETEKSVILSALNTVNVNGFENMQKVLKLAQKVSETTLIDNEVVEDGNS